MCVCKWCKVLDNGHQKAQPPKCHKTVMGNSATSLSPSKEEQPHRGGEDDADPELFQKKTRAAKSKGKAADGQKCLLTTMQSGRRVSALSWLCYSSLEKRVEVFSIHAFTPWPLRQLLKIGAVWPELTWSRSNVSQVVDNEISTRGRDRHAFGCMTYSGWWHATRGNRTDRGTIAVLSLVPEVAEGLRLDPCISLALLGSVQGW